MGFLDKMKNLFTDEIEDEPIKSEVRQVEIPAPAKEEVKIEPKIETEKKVDLPKEEKCPIFFDDDYFKELEQPKKEPPKSSYLKEQVKLKEEKKQFKPTPIISPIYGVLDKNYNKEDITAKKVIRTSYTNTNITIDDVRNKAYGSLEDELANSLFSDNDDMLDDNNLKRVKNPIIDKNIKDSDDLLEELSKEVPKKEILENPIKKEEPINIIDDINLVEEALNEVDQPSNTSKDSELFDLIDSMYDKEDNK